MILSLLSSPIAYSLEYDPVPRFIDALGRLISDHIHIIKTESGLLSQILSLYISILQNCSNLNYCNLVTDTLNELFINMPEIPSDCVTLVPNLIHALVNRSSLPESCFVSTSQRFDEEDVIHKLRQSCQDVTLSLASSSIGVFTIASSLISITGSIAIQESVLCLFCGIVDSIEESLLPLFVDSPIPEDSLNSRITKRTDIPITPVVTKYDEILEYVYQHMNEYTVHPILLSTALQVMFSFDNWTFSRRELCRHLFTYVLSACSSSPISLLPRLFQYICRLYESPVLAVSREMIEQILSLSGYIATMEVENVHHDYMQLVATSICYMDEKQALEMLLEVITPICGMIKSGSDTLPFQMVCLTGVLDGCLVESLANQIASPILLPLQSVFCSLFQQRSPILLHVICVCMAVVRAADMQLDERNSTIILDFCNQLVGVEEFRDPSSGSD